MKIGDALSLGQSIKLVAGYTLRRIAWSRRTFFLMLLLAIPMVFVVIIRSQSPVGAIGSFQTTVLPSLILSIFQILCAFLATGLVRDGIEDHTINFLLTRPIGRTRIVFGLYLGFLMLALPTALLSTGLSFAACVVGGGETSTLLLSDPSTQLLKVTALAVTFYGALYTLFGMIFRHPAIVGIAYLVLVEGFLGSLPGPPRRIVPSAWFEEMLVPHFATRVALERGTDIVEQPGGFVPALVAYAIVLFLMAKKAKGLDFVSSQKES
jgi:hypothetical protein